MPARHFLVSGRVQGVGFRYHARTAARSLHLSGWVRNLADGRVESVAEGGSSDLDAFESWLRNGPEFARVDRVEVSTGESRSLADFEIRR